MLESIRRALTVPRVSAGPFVSAGVVLSFLWLLANDLVHPFVIYLAQIYLMF